MDFKDFSGSLVEGFKAALNNVSLGDLKNVVTNSSADNIKTPIESIKEYAEYLNAGALNHFWGFVKQIYRNNPIQAPILVLQVLTGACPSLVTAPFYTLLGFGRLGPLLGYIFAYLQSIYGVNAFLSMLQSAAMGGYGAPIVAGGVRAASFAGAAVNLAKGFCYDSTETAPSPGL